MNKFDDYDAEVIVAGETNEVIIKVICEREIDDVFEMLEFVKTWAAAQLLEKPTNKLFDGIH